MTCQVCEMRLAGGDAGAEVQEHLNRCAACRAMAEELNANAEALAELREEALPAVTVSRRRRKYAWIAAAAAALVLLAVLPQVRHGEPPPAPAPAKPQAMLKIKMLTSDPDVVIYWMVEGE